MPAFQQTQTWEMSEQPATLHLQTGILARNIGVTPNDLLPGGQFYDRKWTLNMFIINAASVDWNSPNNSILSQQVLLTTTALPERAGRFSSGTQNFVFDLTWNFQMPFLAEGAEPRSLFILFAPELGPPDDTTRFQIPMSTRSRFDPLFLAENVTDWQYTANPNRLISWGPGGSGNGRLPISLEINTVPSPGTGLLATGALTVAAAFRRRRESHPQL